MQTTTRSKMWLSGACCLVCGCRGGGSGQKILRLGIICQHTLDPGGSCCMLALLTNADLKADITLFISKKSCSFNTVTHKTESMFGTFGLFIE